MLDLKNNEITDIFFFLQFGTQKAVCKCTYSLLSGGEKFSLNLTVQVLELHVVLNNVNELV